ncbi:MAG: MerR family transcriptional regulator [Candidatus Marinimicrobia bacterium]|nr:MerR family transcriptional regulator [Candidatus Neomarinimicrobiota bacterium]MBL7046614.1 MerR family transcriptional regulator [Candidatus Neomarinimicrobiota bacterium]
MGDPLFDDPTKPLYPLRVASELSNTSVYSLRKYVDEGLILPYQTPTKRRLYSQVDIKRILCIRKYLDEYGLNIAGIKALFAQVPCWLLKPCNEEDCIQCEAYTSATEPCWQVTTKGPTCKNEDCQTCAVYRLPEKCDDIKSLFKNLQQLNRADKKGE